MIRRLLFTLSFIIGGINLLFASHLMGGSIGYEFIEVTAAGYYRYKITMTTYTNCEQSGPNAANPPYWNGPPTGNQEIGIYAHDAFNNPTGGASSKTLIQTLDLIYQASETVLIEPQFPAGCNFSTTACIYKGVYSATVDLGTLDPVTGNVNFSINGYHLVYERCCRNNNINNVIGNSSMTYYAYIPSDLLENSSPIFTDDPLPFLCVDDTNSLLNSAYDPDGDEIVFSLVRPYDANTANGGNPFPGASGTLQWPISEVTYNGGYSAANPFGANGYDYISASSGLTAYKSNQLGLYVVAVELKEYRNGVLIGVSRRDIQIQYLACLPNNPANLNAATGLSTLTQFDVEEGATLCFDYGFEDIDQDSIYLNSSGQIFDPNFVNPPATVSPNPAAGNDTVSSSFCWTTGCGQAKSLPYFFQVSAIDNGCPPKTTNIVYEINVNEVDPPTDIFGDVVYCQNSAASYWTNNIPNTTYNWSISGGIILQDLGDSVVVQWTNAGTGTIQLNAVNQYGCTSSPILKNTTVTPAPSVNAGNDLSICQGDSIELIGTTSANPGYTSAWTPNNGTVSSPSNLQTYVTPTDTTTYYLTVDIGGGCSGIDSIVVNVETAEITAANDITICEGDTIELTSIGNGTSYQWTPNNFLDQATNDTTNAWPNVTTNYTVETTTSNGCTDTDDITVFVNNNPGSNPNFILNGDAANLGGNEYLLTNAINWQEGAIWNSTRVNLLQPFHFDVDLYFGVNDATGADGIAFGLQQLSNTALASGGGIGYENLSPSFFVEFDTWQNTQNNDIANDHVAIQKDGVLDHNSANNLWPAQSLGTGNIEDGLWHNAVFDWNPTTQVFTVEFDGSQLININYDIINNIFNGNTATFWGFTSATGGSNNLQKVKYNNTSNFNAIIDHVICDQDSININSPVYADTYLWEPNNFIDDNSIENPVFYPSSTTTYYFTGTNSFGCFIKDTFQIAVNDLPTVDAGLDQDICLGDSISLNASGNANIFNWDNGINDGINFEVQNTLDYILTGTSLDGCINYDTVTINALPVPITFTGETDGYINLCINDSVQLNASGADNYLWSPNTFLSDPNIPNPWATPTVGTQYILTGSLANGCSNTDTLQIDVNPLPVLSNNGDQTICQGDSVQIQAFGGITFNWISPDSINDPNISNPVVWPDTTTICHVLISDLNTCEDTSELTVFVNPKPTIDAGNDQNICIGDSTSLIANGGAISYTWNNGISDGVSFQVNSTQDYILTGTDINGCINSDTVTVNLIPLPIIDAGNNLSICLDDSIQLNASGADSYIWSPNINISDINVQNPFVSPSTNFEYFVTGTDTNGCVNIDSVDITIDALPTITTSNDTALCIGDSIGILANGGIQYTWLTTDSMDNINIADPTIWPTNSTIYQVYVTGSNNCSDTAEINITVNNLPNIDAGIDVDVCIGDTIQLSASGGTSYAWITNINISDTSLSNPNVWPTNTIMYELTGIDANQCINIDSINVTVLSLPVADAGPDLWICPGGTIQLSASGGLNYLWIPDSTLTNGSIQNPDATPFDDEIFIVSVTDLNNCTNTDTLLLEVQPEVPTDAGGDTLTICEGLSQVLGGTPTSPSGTIYQWNPSTNLSSPPSSSNPVALPLNPTWYYVETNNDTCTGLDSVFVNFFPTLIASSGNDQQICIGDTTIILASGGSSYSWSPIVNSNGDTIISNDTIINPQVFPMDTTVFFVTIMDTNSCIEIDSTEIIVNPLPNFDLGSNTSICLYDSLQLLASSGITYQWIPNYNITNTSIANPSVFNELDTTYYVTVTDTNGCVNEDSISINVNSLPTVTASGNDTICFGNNTQLIATGALSYIWTPSDSLSNPSIPYPVANPVLDTSYVVNGTDANGCSDSDTINITVLPLPTPIAGEDTTVCPGITVQLNGSGGIDYQWLNPVNLTNFLIANPVASPDTSSEYVLQVTDTNGCINSDTMYIFLYPEADANAGFDVPACLDQPVQLQATGGVSYQWEPSYYVNHDTISNPMAFPNEDMEFIVEVIDSNGCIDSDSMRIYLFIANTIEDTLICSGDSILANISGDPATNFSWSPTNGVSDSSSYEPYLSPTSTTNYIVTIQNASGCIIKDTLRIEIPNPVANFDTILSPGCEGVVMNYTNTSNSNLDINWEFSDGSSSISNEVEKVFDFESTFSATLFVEDEYGCVSSTTFNGSSLSFDDYFSVYYPNVFTPNNDGENDQFIIDVPGKLYECTDLVIYNRWGQIQFISTGYNLKWDGRNNVGGLAPNGTYFYTLSIKDKSFDGSLYLFR